MGCKRTQRSAGIGGWRAAQLEQNPTTNGRSNPDLLSEAGAVDSDFLTLAGKGAVADFEDGFGNYPMTIFEDQKSTDARQWCVICYLHSTIIVQG